MGALSSTLGTAQTPVAKPGMLPILAKVLRPGSQGNRTQRPKPQPAATRPRSRENSIDGRAALGGTEHLAAEACAQKAMAKVARRSLLSMFRDMQMQSWGFGKLAEIASSAGGGVSNAPSSAHKSMSGGPQNSGRAQSAGGMVSGAGLQGQNAQNTGNRFAGFGVQGGPVPNAMQQAPMVMTGAMFGAQQPGAMGAAGATGAAPSTTLAPAQSPVVKPGVVPNLAKTAMMPECQRNRLR